jgi:hypothetical protein
MPNDDRPSPAPLSWRSPPPAIRPIGDPMPHDGTQLSPPAMAMAGSDDGSGPEDPRALARRLALEAKARSAAAKAPAPAAPPEGSSALGRAPPPKKAAPPPVPRPGVTAVPEDHDDADDHDDAMPASLHDLPPLSDDEPLPPVKSQPLSARSLPPPAAPTGRAMTAAEALRAAMAAEEDAPPQRPPPPRSRNLAAPEPERDEPVKPSPQRQPAANRDPIAAVQAAIAGATVTSPVVIGRFEVFKALWRAHRARAHHEGNPVMAATASVLLDAADRVPPGSLIAVRISHAGREWAGWVDASRGVLLGVAEPADVYLAGI